MFHSLNDLKKFRGELFPYYITFQDRCFLNYIQMNISLWSKYICKQRKRQYSWNPFIKKVNSKFCYYYCLDNKLQFYFRWCTFSWSCGRFWRCCSQLVEKHDASEVAKRQHKQLSLRLSGLCWPQVHRGGSWNILLQGSSTCFVWVATPSPDFLGAGFSVSMLIDFDDSGVFSLQLSLFQ